MAEPEPDSEYWARYYEVTAERPAWKTVLRAIELFATEDAPDPQAASRFAVDLGCGGGRDTRALLRAGWRVLAVDREPGAIEFLGRVVEPELKARLQTRVADLASFDVPACDLVNASLCLPFLERDGFDAAWDSVVGALGPGGRFAAMLFGDRDDSVDDPAMTCLPPQEIESRLSGFEIESWNATEEDTTTALGEPHHFHLVQFVARKAG